MTDYGVTDAGFVLKRLAEIKADLAAALSTVQDNVSGEYLTPNLDDEDDPLVQEVNALADALADAWEVLQLCYNQFDPLKATGAGLSGVVQLNGLRRLPGSKSTVTVTITGTPGLTLVAGQRISTNDNTPVFELPLVQIGIGGTVSATATCIEDGPFTADASTVVKILTPVSGWTAVTNPLAAVPGSYEETDEELRARQQLSTENTGRGMIDDLFSALIDLEGVLYCRCYQNLELTEDDRGIPGKSVAIVISGGDEDEIAEAIFNHIPIGVSTYGTTEIQLIDEQGFAYLVHFSRPIEIPIHVEVAITPFAPDWPDDGDDTIAAAILAYGQSNYLPGVDVYASQLFIPANTLPGVQIVSLVLSLDDSSSMFDSSGDTPELINIAWNEQATFSGDNIVVTTVG